MKQVGPGNLATFELTMSRVTFDHSMHAHCQWYTHKHTHTHTHTSSPQMQRELDRANGQITTLEERLKVLQKERMGAYDERDEMTTKLYKEKLARKAVEKEVYIRACTYAHVYTCMYICTCIYMIVHTCIHAFCFFIYISVCSVFITFLQCVSSAHNCIYMYTEQLDSVCEEKH